MNIRRKSLFILGLL